MTATVGSTPVTFLGRAERDLRDDRLRAAVRNATNLMAGSRLDALAGLEDPDGLRDAARTLRAGVMAELPELLDEWSTRFEALGGHVHWAADAAEATAIVRDLVRAQQAPDRRQGQVDGQRGDPPQRRAGGRRAWRSSRPTSASSSSSWRARRPSHIIAPAIHHDRYTVADLFAADGGHPVEADIGAEAAYAQVRLRESFLAAGVGISGVNFAVAETGSICLVENEGNGRMCTSVPKVHIAIMGMERIVRDWSELDVMLGLLARSATGQALSVYTNIITGPRRAGDVDGPDEVHVVVLDNGRSRILGSAFQEALHCIRCGACLNACPVYRQVGGHAYGVGVRRADRRRPHAAAPPGGPGGPGAGRGLDAVRGVLGGLPGPHPAARPAAAAAPARRRHATPGRARRLGFTGWSWLWSTRAGFAASTQLGRLGRRLARGRTAAARLGRQVGRGPGAAVTTKEVFLRRLRTAAGPGAPPPHRPLAPVDRPPEVRPVWPDAAAPMTDRWVRSFEGLGGHVHRTTADGSAPPSPRSSPAGARSWSTSASGTDSAPAMPAGRRGAGVAGLRAGGGGHRGQRGGRGHRRHRLHRQHRRRQRPQRPAGQPAPRVAVFVLSAADIVPATGDLLRHRDERWPDGPPTNVVLVTGPSRSGDIEMSLVVGVHGPGEVHAILIDR